MIRLENVSKSYDGGKTYTIEDFNLSIEEGELVVLLGSSGSGKSTILKMINRLLEPSSGSITLDGQDVAKQDPIALRRKIGYAFQEIGLFPHLTVSQNIVLVPRLLGWSKKLQQDKANALLEMIKLAPEEYAHRLPSQLSGGQQQRVGVARALAADSKYLLMDEPFGALDAITRESLQQEILQIKTKLDKTILFVTHDIFEALTLADKIGIVNNGRLEQFGSKAEVLKHPATAFVRELFQRPAQQLKGLPIAISDNFSPHE